MANAQHGDRAAWFQGGCAQCSGTGATPLRAWRMLLLGAPGIGKGTQAEYLSAYTGACHLSTGDVFRFAKNSGGCLTPSMPSAMDSMKRGELVPDGVVIEVKATGLCRSDWHGWMGHDADITPPHVPGHELAGVVAAVGKDVTRWQVGDRVTLPFVCGCGRCPQCLSGNHQVCDAQFQPGFTHWGSFAEYVAVQYADVNLVRLPESVGFETAASLGCRFVTSFRGVVDQGRVRAGEWVAVHGCGGVGLSAIMIASALGANVIAIDIADDKLDFA